MRVFIIFIISICFCVLTSSRPTNDENSRDTSDAEYEGNDDSKQEEYISEEQESANDEVQRSAVNHDEKRESQDEFSHNNRDSRPDQNDGYKELSDADLNDDKEVHPDGPNTNTKHENDFFLQSGRKIYRSDTNKAEDKNEDLTALRDHDQKLGGRNLNAEQIPQYSGDLLFKIAQENLNKERNDQIEIDNQPNSVKQHYNKMQQNKDSSDGRTYENTFNIRDRRETQSPQSEAKSDTINESSESSIIDNIKKLSDKDLENLLNALPEDKKAILRKIMDKREITKKAGAVDDHSLDTSKLEGSFSIDSKTVSDLATDASESNKPGEGEESSTKTQENETDSGKTDSKSSLDANTNGQTLDNNVEAATLSNYNKETYKNDNKREISLNEHREQLQEDIKSGDDATDENSYDLSSNQEVICSDNEDWLESKAEGSNTQKRQVSKENLFENDDSVRSLEESFPNSDAYDDKNLNMEPLVRVKRTETNHRVKKRDLSSFENEVPFVPNFQDKKYVSGVLNELEGKSYLNNPASNIRCDRQINRNSGINVDERFLEEDHSRLSDNSELVETASDSIKEIVDNIKYNSNIKNKIPIQHDKDDNIKLIRSGRTIDPLNSDSHLASDNCVDTANSQREESLESHLENSENYLSRSKRI